MKTSRNKLAGQRKKCRIKKHEHPGEDELKPTKPDVDKQSSIYEESIKNSNGHQWERSMPPVPEVIKYQENIKPFYSIFSLCLVNDATTPDLPTATCTYK